MITTMQYTEGSHFDALELLNPYTDKWAVRWIDGDTLCEETRIGKPTLEEVKSLITAYFNGEADAEILSGFEWKGSKVWLSQENQLNYKAAFDLAMQLQGAHSTLPVTFKFGDDTHPVYHEFKTIEDLTDFYLSTVGYITQTLAKYWLKKDAVKWDSYEQQAPAEPLNNESHEGR